MNNLLNQAMKAKLASRKSMVIKFNPWKDPITKEMKSGYTFPEV